MNKNLTLGIGIILLIAGAYYFGSTSKSNTEQTTLPTQETIPTPESAPQKNYVPPTNNLVNDSTNGLNCKTVANTAAKNNQARTGYVTYVSLSHFSKTYNNCYYELTIFLPPSGSSSSDISTQIRFAPDDDWIAECSSGVYPPPQLFCTIHNVGVGPNTEQEYQQLKAKYFTN